MSETSNPEIPIEIQAGDLSPEALDGVIQSYILREGTDYGRVEVDHFTKVNQVKKQLEQGSIKIIFDMSTQSVSLLQENDFKRRMLSLK